MVYLTVMVGPVAILCAATVRDQVDRLGVFSVGAAARIVNNTTMYFILACLWLLGGVGLLVYQWVSGDQRMALNLGDTPFSCGWIMILLSGWNFARWYSRRVNLPARQTATLFSQHQRIRRITEPVERDPNFIFTDEPPRQEPTKEN